MKTRALCVVICLASAPAAAQVEQVVTPPPNIVLSNYSGVPIGPFGGLEGAAYVARVGDPSATWFNPAGLTRENSAQISGSAGVYQQTSVSPQALPNSGGSNQQLPNFVGFTYVVSPRLALGAAILTTNAWNQETASELITPVAVGQRRFAYSADSDYEQRVLTMGAGYHGQSPWRYGGGLAISVMSLRLVQTVSDRLADSTGLRSLLVTARADASAIQLRGQGGAQYDAQKFRFGGAIRTPGLTVHRTGLVSLDGLLDAGASSLGASVFDADAESAYHLPWELQGGVAWIHPRAEIEVDVQGYSSISAYSLIATGHPTVIYGDQGTGTPPSVLSRPFPGLTSASDGVVNVSAGGHYRLLSDRDLRVHAGVGSNRSPVADGDTVFNKIDLQTWTVGLSGSLGKFQFAAGVNRQTGHHNIAIRNLLSGQAVQSPVDIHTTGFIYSLAYQF